MSEIVNTDVYKRDVNVELDLNVTVDVCKMNVNVSDVADVCKRDNECN